MAALTRELSERTLDGRRLVLAGGLTGAIGGVVLVIGCVVEPERAFAAYLAAWATAATIGVGGLVVLLIGYAANARWPAALRRVSEAIASGLLPIAVLAIPLVVFADRVWPWAQPGATRMHAVEVKRAYLSLGPFAARTALYLAIFVVPAELLRRWSRRRDSRPEPPAAATVDALDRERRFASAMLPLVGLALTFAAFDWLMSLQPEWWSSGFGLYVVTGALSAGLAMTIVLAWRGTAREALPLGPDHFHALGRLLHAFVILWTYIAYFQAMLIQIANRPDEATFYLDRSAHGWRVVTAVLFVLKFAVPFPLLLSRRLKRRARYLGAIAVMLLVAQYIDMWWLVIPHVRAAPIPSWTDVAALCAIGGTAVAVCAWRARGVPLVPVGDPYLAQALHYESTT